MTHKCARRRREIAVSLNATINNIISWLACYHSRINRAHLSIDYNYQLMMRDDDVASIGTYNFSFAKRERTSIGNFRDDDLYDVWTDVFFLFVFFLIVLAPLSEWDVHRQIISREKREKEEGEERDRERIS